MVSISNCPVPQYLWGRRYLEGRKGKSPGSKFAARLQKLTMEEKIEIWGDGKQTRSFLYVDECLEG